MAERKPIKSDADIRNAKPENTPYRRAVGHGLYLEVRPATEAHPHGLKLFRYRYRLPGADGVRKENMFAVGAYGKRGAAHGELTLLEAITERARLRELVKQGKHPIAERRERKQATIMEASNTVRHVAQKWIETKRGKSAHYFKQIERAFRDDVYPVIGDRAISSVTSFDLSEILEARAKLSPTIASFLQQWLGALWRFAILKRYLPDGQNPAYLLRGTVERPEVQSKTPLLKADIPAFCEALEKNGGNLTTKIALKLLMLTFVRPGELCGARWAEFDLDAAIWKIPAERMKRRREHWVPLSRQALALLRELQPLTGGQQWLFPNNRDPKNSSMTTKALGKSLDRMGYKGKFSAHGFRATASTGLHELGCRHEAIEFQLAHKAGNKTSASYNAAEYWGPRVKLMQTWADVIDAWKAKQDYSPATAANITPLREAAAA